MSKKVTKSDAVADAVKPRYVLGECYMNAFKNLHGAFKDLGLHVVIGSLGLNGHYEYGGREYTLADFTKKWNDSHAWLEDAEGNVYDFIFDFYGDCAKHWGKKVTFRINCELRGVAKRDLLRQRLSYVPAPPDAQLYIATRVHALYGINLFT
jgi:hypothetical protein